jgi:hypothetical protein
MICFAARTGVKKQSLAIFKAAFGAKTQAGSANRWDGRLRRKMAV